MGGLSRVGSGWPTNTFHLFLVVKKLVISCRSTNQDSSATRKSQEISPEIPARKISLLSRPFGLGWRDKNKVNVNLSRRLILSWLQPINQFSDLKYLLMIFTGRCKGYERGTKPKNCGKFSSQANRRACHYKDYGRCAKCKSCAGWWKWWSNGASVFGWWW